MYTHLVLCLRSGDNALSNIPQVIGIKARNLLQAGTVESLDKLACWILELGRRDRDSPRCKSVQDVCHFHRRKLRLRLHLGDVYYSYDAPRTRTNESRGRVAHVRSASDVEVPTPVGFPLTTRIVRSWLFSKLKSYCRPVRNTHLAE